jgi:drug/metabolite transporter (DMT)-like permease
MAYLTKNQAAGREVERLDAQDRAGRIEKRWSALSGNLRGILWISMGTIAFALNDVCVKQLGRKFDPMEIAFFRYLVGFVILSPVFWRMGRKGLATARPGIHFLRLVMACIAQIGVFMSLIHLYLADATAISFSRPLFTTIVAVILLSELVSRKRWVATGIGFIGVIIMVRPGHDGYDPIALIAVGAAMTFAVANVLIRMMSTTEPPNRILFYYHLGGTLVFVGPTIWFWSQPVGVEWLLLAAIGALTTIGMIGFVRGFSAGESNAVGPMEYIRLIYAALLGFYIFAEVPDIWTAVGATIIVGSTLYIARDEHYRNRKAVEPPE